MVRLYYYLVLLNAAVSAGTAVVVFWKNRHFLTGQLLSAGIMAFALWLVGYAQYFTPLAPAVGMWWAKFTLTASLINQPVILHGICAYVGKARRLRWWLTLFYVMAAAFVVLLWQGQLVTGLRPAAYMDHYIRSNLRLYPLLGLFYITTIALGLGVLIRSTRQAVGYRRTQLIYFIVAWCVVIGTTYFVVLPIEYGFSMQPVGFFVLPINMAFLAYVLSQARLADYNAVIARALVYSVTLLMVAGASLLFIGAITLAAPGFMNAPQALLTVMMVVSIGLALTITLPRFLPRVERLMQERLFGARYGYQEVLADLVRELSHLGTIDEVLRRVVTKVHSKMQVRRAMILLEDPLTGDYRLQAESGLREEERETSLRVLAEAMLVQWLQTAKDTLVRDELPRRTDAETMRLLEADLDRLEISLAVPMMMEGKLIGFLGLGEKNSRDMFLASDIKLLETLGAEVVLAVKYRRMEEQISRQNRLIELGTIAAGVAHEIRNPLASIRTFAQLLPERSEDPEFKNEFSKLVLKDVDRITKVIETMLAFARPSQVTIATYCIKDLVEEAILLVQARLKSKRVELSKQFHEEPTLQVDKQQILQVLVNLLSNAVDAVPEHGKIEVSTGIRALEAPENPANERQYGVIEISDNGHGIPSNLRSRLFDPFFTTKKNGTGLGLSISQKIIRDHGGMITCSSIEGAGTTFQVNLPLN